jgi:hypothetical protein
LIALHLIAEEARGLGIEAGDAEDQAMFILEDPYLRPLGRGRAIIGVHLAEVVCGRNAAPASFIETAIDDDALAGSDASGTHDMW